MWLRTCLLSLIPCTWCCVNEEGAPVSWFFIYKQPGAYSYAYLDSNSLAGSTLAISPNSINTTNSALGKTLSPLYSASTPAPAPAPAPSSGRCCHYSDASCSPGETCCTTNCDDPSTCSYTESGCVGRYGQLHGCEWTGTTCIVGSNAETASLLAHVAYNDAVPNGATNSALAHAKGVLVFDGSSGQGWWLIHSLPKFPDLKASHYSWSGSTVYGQSFLCMTLSNTDVDTAARLLMTDVPNVYSSNMPSTLSNVVPDLASLIANPTQGGEASMSSTITPINAGLSFTVFAKSAAWGRDLYEDLVEPTLEAPFYWETWRRKPQEPTDCTFNSTAAYDTMNVEYMQFGSDQPFRYTKDHSKIGYSVDATAGWVCVGDINRMTSQSKRGGGTACTQGSSTLYSALSAAVFLHDSCSTRHRTSTGVRTEPSRNTLPKRRVDDTSLWVDDADAHAHPEEAPRCSCAVVSASAESGSRNRTVAACNDDHGWLRSTYLCDSWASAGGSVARCIESVERSAGTDCACLKDVCVRPDRTALKRDAAPPHPTRSCARNCHRRCWLDTMSTCSGYDDQQSACVFFCSEYCFRHSDCMGRMTEIETPEVLDKSDLSAGLAEPGDDMALWCRHLRGCERVYLDPVWSRAPTQAAARLADYSDCKLRCLLRLPRREKY